MMASTTDRVGAIRRAAIGAAIAFAALAATPVQAADIAVNGATARMRDDAVNGRRIEVYMNIANEGGADRLFAVRSRLSRMTMLSVPEQGDHAGHGAGTMAGMPEHLRTSVLEIPARGVARLEMGGAHIMLMQPEPVPQPGETFPVTLFFERAGRLDVNVVLAAGGMADGEDGHGAGR